LVDIVVDPNVFTKLSPVTLEQIRQKMLRTPNAKRPKAKGKWQELVDLDDGCRYAVNCHREGDKIAIIGARRALIHKRRIRP